MAGNATMAFIFAAGIATGLGLATIGGGISTSKTSGQVSPPSHNPSIPALSVSDSSTPNRPSTLTATSPSNTRHSFAIAANPADPIANADRILVHGAPSSPVEPVLPKSAYVVAYNKRTGNPLWVAQRFSKVTPLLEVPELPATVSDDTSEVGDQEEGTGQLRPATRGHTFRSDPLLPQLFRVSPSSYTSSGFDRGHMVPRADVANAAVGAGFSPVETAKCVEETYLMTNISPQYPSFNRHIWSRLESFVRRAASTYSDLVVITGPAWVPIWHVDKKKWRIEYEVMAPPPNVSDSSGALNSTAPPVHVPTHFFKCLLGSTDSSSSDQHCHMSCFLLPHIPNYPPGATLDDYRVSLQELERSTGLRLFPNVRDAKGENSVPTVELCEGGLVGCKVTIGTSKKGEKFQGKKRGGGKATTEPS